MKECIYFKGNFIYFLDDNALPGNFLPVSVNCSFVDNTYPIAFRISENPNDSYRVQKGRRGYIIWKGDRSYASY